MLKNNEDYLTGVTTIILLIICAYVQCTSTKNLNRPPTYRTQDSGCPINCNCSQPKSVDCSASGITDTIFEKIDVQTIHLNVSANNLNGIPITIADLIHLISLNASFNRISHLSDQLFATLPNLKTLDLSHNAIKKLSDINSHSIFYNLKLQHLNLSFNPINTLGMDELDYIFSRTILHLDLHNCKLQNLGPAFLEYLPAIQSVNLSHNQISQIVYLSSKSLITLDLSHNNLLNLQPNCLYSLSRLSNLHLSHNRRLNSLNFNYQIYSDTLTTVDVSYCSLRTNYASQLKNVRHMILKGNQLDLSESPGEFENNTNLEYVDLSENRIHILHEETFRGAASLKHIDLSYNSIKEIPEQVFTYSSQLTTLNAAQNSFQSYPKFTSSSLHSLDLSGSQIKSWTDSGTLKSLPSLQTLNLSGNPLDSMPVNLQSNNLQILDLSDCKLATINWEHLKSLPSLTQLYLARNRLYTLRVEYFERNPKLNKISLEYNLWSCDCFDDSFQKLWMFLDRLNSSTENLLCQEPPELTGKQWYVACYNLWGPEATSGRNSSLIAIVVIVIILVGCGIVACIFAVRQTILARRNPQQEATADGADAGEIQHLGSVSGAAECENEDGAVRVRIRESVRVLTQLPSYDEALLLPKPDSELGSAGDVAMRQSGTQTDATLAELLKQIGDRRRKRKRRQRAESVGNVNEVQGNDYGGQMETNEPSSKKERWSWANIEYLNIENNQNKVIDNHRLTYLCTEL